MERLARLVVIGLLLLSTTGTPLHAQGLATIAGVVKDVSGAVLPGVTVEASSPALIEKIRVVVTDGQGAYRIVDLRPGRYEVTFTVTGFSSVKREGIELSADFTASINAELKVGSVSETITVTGESPIVDVQRATQTRALTADNFASIPSGKSYANMAVLIPAISFTAGRQDVGGADGNAQGDLISAHGSTAGDATLMFDGLRMANMISTGDRSSMQQSPLLFEQVTVQYAGNSGESASSAPQINTIPKSGGNAFHPVFYTDFANNNLQASNLTQRIQDLSVPGQVATSRIYTLRDVNGAVGGPIIRDRIWFYANVRHLSNGQYVPNLFYPVDAAAPVRVADATRQGFDDFTTQDQSLRLTIQATQKQKLSVFYVNQTKCNCHFFSAGTLSPEATTRAIFPVNMGQATWSYALTNRVFLEAGIAPGSTPWATPPQPEATQIPIFNTGIQYRSNGNLTGAANAGHHNALHQTSYRASISYVTGRHNAKFGWDMMQGSDERAWDLIQGGVAYTFVNNQPSAVTIVAPLTQGATFRLNYNMGFYGQDQWTVNRLTVNAALRLDMQRESVDALTVGPSLWAPTRSRAFAAIDNVPNWKDVNPRLGASYDVFGNGKTALKMSASRGVRQETAGTVMAVSPIGAFTTLATSTGRTWNDLNGNFKPDCDLANPAANGGECGPWLNASFTNANNIAVAGSQLDPDYVTGWGKRPYDWDFSASIQRELAPRFSVNVGYFRRIFGNFVVTDNQQLTAADFRTYQVLVPTDPRLPGAGQSLLTQYDVNRVVPANNLVTTTSNLGLNQTQHWNGVDLGVDARLRNGLLFQGGVSTGRTATDNCEVIAALPEANAATSPLEYCHNDTPFLTSVKVLGSYELPWAGVRISASFQNIPVNPPVTATVNFPTSVAFSSAVPSIAAQLGRPFNSGATANLNVISPNSIYNDRINQLDLKFAKVVSIQRGKLYLTMDLFNAFNSDAILNQSFAYGSSTVISPQGVWLRPTSILQARFVKFGARIEF